MGLKKDDVVSFAKCCWKVTRDKKIRLNKTELMVDLDKCTLCRMVHLEDLVGVDEEGVWGKYM